MPKQQKTDPFVAAVQSMLVRQDYDGKNSPEAKEFLEGGRTAPLAPDLVDNLTSAMERAADSERAAFTSGLLQLIAPAVQLLPPGVLQYVQQFITTTLGQGRP